MRRRRRISRAKLLRESVTDLTAVEFAKELGLAIDQYIDWEQGKHIPRFSSQQVARIAARLHTEPSFLVDKFRAPIMMTEVFPR